MQKFKSLNKFIKSKDRKHPFSFVVFIDENDKKSSTKAKDAVVRATQGLYELFLQPTNMSFVSDFLQNKVCDLYLICESCNQIQGRTATHILNVIFLVIIIIIIYMHL